MSGGFYACLCGAPSGCSLGRFNESHESGSGWSGVGARLEPQGQAGPLSEVDPQGGRGTRHGEVGRPAFKLSWAADIWLAMLVLRPWVCTSWEMNSGGLVASKAASSPAAAKQSPVR